MTQSCVSRWPKVLWSVCPISISSGSPICTVHTAGGSAASGKARLRSMVISLRQQASNTADILQFQQPCELFVCWAGVLGWSHLCHSARRLDKQRGQLFVWHREKGMQSRFIANLLFREGYSTAVLNLINVSLPSNQRGWFSGRIVPCHMIAERYRPGFDSRITHVFVFCPLDCVFCSLCMPCN